MTLPRFVGRYEVREEIARGGFAVVVKAWDEELECLVALKILHESLANDDRIEQRIEALRIIAQVERAVFLKKTVDIQYFQCFFILIFFHFNIHENNSLFSFDP